MSIELKLHAGASITRAPSIKPTDPESLIHAENPMLSNVSNVSNGNVSSITGTETEGKQQRLWKQYLALQLQSLLKRQRHQHQHQHQHVVHGSTLEHEHVFTQYNLNKMIEAMQKQIDPATGSGTDTDADTATATTRRGRGRGRGKGSNGE